MSAESRIQAYYDALRDGDPLYPYFAPDESVVKFGISEHLDGYEAVEAGLREQSRTTTDWAVESRDLRVTERDRHAWFADLVGLAWTDTKRSIRYEFDTRWSGTLEREQHTRGERVAASPPRNDEVGDADLAPGDWRFVGMHVSTAGDL